MATGFRIRILAWWPLLSTGAVQGQEFSWNPIFCEHMINLGQKGVLAASVPFKQFQKDFALALAEVSVSGFHLVLRGKQLLHVSGKKEAPANGTVMNAREWGFTPRRYP